MYVRPFEVLSVFPLGYTIRIYVKFDIGKGKVHRFTGIEALYRPYGP